MVRGFVQAGLLGAALLCTTAHSTLAQATRFSTFTPLPGSVPAGSLPESTPFQLSAPNFQQRTLNANDLRASNGGIKLGDNWDMITLNENGPSAGRYLFTPYETGSAGVQRLDLQTGTAVNLVAPGTQGFVNGDASRWTPFGTYLTAEESWNGTSNGRLFEITNPLAAPGSANFVQQNIIPRVSHEGLTFDKANNLYFVDELNGGSIYRYTSATPNNGATFFAAGQTSILRVGAGGNSEATGSATWVPITDANGNPLPGIPTIAGGAIDGRLAADVVSGTGYGRPEDLEIRTLPNGDQILFFAATTNHNVFSVALADPNNPIVKLFASQATINAATGLAVGGQFINPDNLAIDAAGNIYIVEDQPGGQADIWFAMDIDGDGVAEYLARWASMSTLGAEPTGLYFSPFNANVAYVNVQHADSDLDRTIQFTAVPEPGTIGLMLAGLASMGMMRRRRSAA